MLTRHTPVATFDAPLTSGSGLVLLDRRGNPLYFNSDAVKVLTYAGPPERGESPLSRLPQEVQRALLSGEDSAGSCREAEFMSGRRRYVCRAFKMTHTSRDPGRATTALVLERQVSKPQPVANLAAQFHLTEREQQTVGHLIDGLSSKEIASRMNISPNTVKTFMHLIMTKMSVPSRSGIIVKLLRT